MLYTRRGYSQLRLFILSIMCLTLTSCGTSDKSTQIVGKWVTMGMQLEVNEDGTLLGHFKGRGWRSKYRFAESSHTRAYTEIPGPEGRTFELLVLSNNSLRLTPITNSDRFDPEMGTQGRPPRKMVLSRARR